jgi:hypothetical protein
MSSLVTYEDVSGAGWSSWPTLSVAHIVITSATTADSLCTAALQRRLHCVAATAEAFILFRSGMPESPSLPRAAP